LGISENDIVFFVRHRFGILDILIIKIRYILKEIMVHYKKLFSLDPECLDILKEEPTKKQSDFVRQAIKHFNANRTKKEEPEKEKKVEVRLI